MCPLHGITKLMPAKALNIVPAWCHVMTIFRFHHLTINLSKLLITFLLTGSVAATRLALEKRTPALALALH